MRRGLAWGLLTVYLLAAAGGMALIAFQGAPADGFGVFAFVGYAAAGTLFALRRPGNAVGWLLLAVAVAFALNVLGAGYVVGDRSNPGREVIAWLTAMTQFTWFPIVAVFLPLLFPHGRPPSPRWRAVLWLGVAGLALEATSSGLAPGRLEISGADVVNPLGVSGPLPEVAGALASVVGIAAMILAAVSLSVRFRRARGVERQQVKWFASVGILGLGLLAVAVLLDLAVGDAAPGWAAAVGVAAWLSGFALLALGLPAATGIAILRYRLYDIDLVIRRTLVYGALTAILGGAYLGLVVLAGLAVGTSDVAIAVSTLAVAGLFRPARARVQAVVDRRFYRRRYDAGRTLEAFGGRLRDEIHLEALSADVRGVVQETLQPAHVSLWLRSER